jgi:hypothetical protein
MVAAPRIGFPKIPFAQVRVALAVTIGILSVNRSYGELDVARRM